MKIVGLHLQYRINTKYKKKLKKKQLIKKYKVVLEDLKSWKTLKAKKLQLQLNFVLIVISMLQRHVIMKRNI